MDKDPRERYFKQVVFTPKYSHSVQCSICGSIWTPGEVAWGLPLRQNPTDTSTRSTSELFIRGSKVPKDLCPGCRYTEGEWI